MPTLTPVDNDPFAPPAGAGSPKLTPVDHDPFAGSTAPANSGATPASFNQSDSLGQMSAFDPRAAKSSWNDFLMAHLAEAGKGIGQIGQTADDYVRSATNAFSVGDRIAAGMSNLTGIGGGDLAAQRAQTAAANSRLPPEARLAANITGYGPFAAQGIAGGLGGGVLGSSAELGTAGALSALGNNTAKTWSGTGENALIGGVAGGVTGLSLGVAGKVLNPIVNAVANKVGRVTGALATPADATATTQAAKEDAYNKFNDVLFHPADIGNGASDVSDGIYANDVDGNYRKNSPQTSKILSDYSSQMNDAALSKQPTTGATLNDTIKKLNGVAQRNPSNFEGVAAAQARDGLTDLFHNTTPLSAPDGFNLDTALAASANANKAYKNADFLEKARQNLKYFGQSPGGDAANIAQKYYPSGGADLEAGRPTQNAAVYKRLSDIALAGGGMPSGYSLAHMVYPLTEAAGAGLGSMVGGPAGAMMGEAGGALAGAGVKTALSNAMSAAQKRATQAAITAAYPDMTGQSVQFPAMNLSPALRAIIFGYGSPYFHPK